MSTNLPPTPGEYLIEFLFGDPIKRQYERIEAAAKRKAEAVADAELHRTLANFYTMRVMTIDPHIDWWGFADAKQKQHEHQVACIKFDHEVEEAHAQVQAEDQRFYTLINKEPQ